MRRALLCLLGSWIAFASAAHAQTAEPGAGNSTGTSWPRHPRYAVIDLGTNYTPEVIANNGMILGGGGLGPARWANGEWSALTAHGLNGIAARSMNNNGVVVGTGGTYSQTDNGYTYSSKALNKAVLWSAGSAEGIVTEPDPVFRGYLLSDPMVTREFGTISYDLITDNGKAYGSKVFQAVNYWASTITPTWRFEMLPNGNGEIDSDGPSSDVLIAQVSDGVAFPNANSSSGVRLGNIYLAREFGILPNGTWVRPLQASDHAIVTQETTFTNRAPSFPPANGTTETKYRLIPADEPPLELPFTYPDGPTGLNNDGIVLGQTFWWDGASHPLKRATEYSYAYAINSRRFPSGPPAPASIADYQILGSALNGEIYELTLWEKPRDGSGPQTGSDYEPLKLQDLISPLPTKEQPTALWEIFSANDINDNGAIAGSAYKTVGGQREYHGVLLLPVDITVKKKIPDSPPTDRTGPLPEGVLLKKGEVLQISLNDIPADSNPLPTGQPVWKIRQMKYDTRTIAQGLPPNVIRYGAWTDWQEFGERKPQFEYAPTAGGIFQIEAVLFGDDANAAKYVRKKDERYGLAKKGDPDAIGVVDDQIQIRICRDADWWLGSSSYAYAAEYYPFPPNTDKCNLFVAHVAGAAGAAVPWINGIHPLTSYPPRANQWAGIEDTNHYWPDVQTDIDGWPLLPAATYPQPGYVMAHPDAGAEGHCGIIDYDGWLISAHTNIVDKITHLMFDGTSRQRKYSP